MSRVYFWQASLRIKFPERKFSGGRMTSPSRDSLRNAAGKFIYFFLPALMAAWAAARRAMGTRNGEQLT